MRITTGTIKLNGIHQPLHQKINWNPNEYRIIEIDTEKGFIILEKIKSE